MNEVENHFGKTLKELRIAKGITQEQLAELIDKSFGAVGQYERGGILPNYETLARIIQALDVDANLFFSRKTSGHSDLSNWMANALFGMTDEERSKVGSFLAEFSRVMLKTHHCSFTPLNTSEESK
jgi:transcriptional regulator with XRE-family HTH domain